VHRALRGGTATRPRDEDIEPPAASGRRGLDITAALHKPTADVAVPRANRSRHTPIVARAAAARRRSR